MIVLAYPINYSGDLNALPLYESDKGELVLHIEFGPYLDLELVNAFIKAVNKGCQWLVFRDKPVRDEREWVNICGKFSSPASEMTDDLSGSVTTVSGTLRLGTYQGA